MARFSKLPYSISTSRASDLFSLVHIDISGAYKVPSRGNHRYFLTLVDDYSRMTWVHLLRHKSDAYDVINNFVFMANTKFEKQVKIIRSDNALEFDDHQYIQFFHEKGILHQTSCVDRPQQNGRVERKHKSILEMARALRFQAGMPLHF